MRTGSAAPQGEPPLLPAYQGDQLLGYVYLELGLRQLGRLLGQANSHAGRHRPARASIRGIKLVDHKEPIVLIGIPEQRIIDAMNSLIGRDMVAVSSGVERPPQVDIVSGATVTVLVMGDSVVRSAVRLIRSGRLGAGAMLRGGWRPPRQETVDLEQERDPGLGISPRRWLGSPSLAHDRRGQRGIRQAGNQAAADNPETGPSRATRFIDLYVAPVSVPTIGRSLLGDAGYERLKCPASGPGSRRSSSRATAPIRSRARAMSAAASLTASSCSRTVRASVSATATIRGSATSRRRARRTLREIALFVVPEDFKLDLTEPWQLQLLVQRNVGARDKAFMSFDLAYTLPDQYIRIEQPCRPRRPVQPRLASPASDDRAAQQPPD